MPTGYRGQTLTLDGFFVDGLELPVVPTGITLDILTPAAVVLVNDAPPTRNVAVGHYQYDFAVPADAAISAGWLIRWTATIDGTVVQGQESFQVALAPLPASAGVCDRWIEEADLGCDLVGVDVDVVDDAIVAASAILYGLSGHRFSGACSTTVRPCPGRANRRAPCACRSSVVCACSSLSQVQLRAPVVEVTEVRVDGETLDPSAYRVDDERWLVRIDGDGWPCCQDMGLDADEDGTFEVTYIFGAAPPVAGQRAAASLACELVAAWTPGDEGDCRLPRKVTTITRQGVTMTVLDNPRELFEDGFTGLEEVDLWLGSLRFASQNRPMKFLSPDRRLSRHRRAGT